MNGILAPDDRDGGRTASLLIDASIALAAARSVGDVVDVLRRSARAAVGAEGITVILRDGDLCHYVAEDAVGPLWTGSRFPAEACVSGLTMRSARTVVVADALHDARVPHELYRDTFVRSLAIAPIGTPEPFAALGAYWSAARTVDDATIARLESLARLATVAIENVRLIEARDRAAALAAAQSSILERVVRNALLGDTLAAVIETVERLSPSRLLGSVLLLSEDGRHLEHGAAPSLPDAYNDAIDGIAIGPTAGSCGTAIHRGEPVIVADIATDALWDDYRDLALGHGLRACWSHPIRSSDGALLGTFAMYHREARTPLPADLEIVDFVIQTASLVIERSKAEAAAKRNAARYRQIVEGAEDFVIVTMDADGTITGWNRGAERVTGYAREQAIGRPGDLFYTAADKDGDVLRDEMVRARGEGRAKTERWHVRASGERFWGSGLMMPLAMDHGGFVKIFHDRTAEHEAEYASQERERELRFALKAGRLGAWRLDLRSELLSSSETCRTNFGRDPNLDFTYAELLAAVHPDDRDRMQGAVAQAIAAGTDYDIEYRAITPSGETRWVQIRAQPSYAADGTPIDMTGVSLDITDRRSAEEQLRRSDARYRTLFEAVDAGFCVIEMKFDDTGKPVDYRFIELNPAFERQTGLVDAGGRWVSDLVPTLEQHWFDLYGRVALTGEAARFENHAEPMGRWFDVHAFRAGTADEHRVAILFNDITERRVAEQRTLELNDTLEAQVADRTAQLRFHRDIIEATESPICAFDHSYRLIAFNQAHSDEFYRIFAHRVQIGEVFPDLFPADQAPIMRGFMARALSGERYTVVEEFGDPDLAKPYWEVAYTPLLDDHGAVVGAFHVAKDITHRLRAEAELKNTQEALRQSQKMEAMGQLTGGVAHDFNNLLTPIVGSLDLLQRKGVGTEREQRLIAGAMQSAERARTLVQRLLAFARRQPLQSVPVDIALLVQGMGGLVSSTTGPQVKVSVDVEVGLPPAMADPNQLEMALLNLSVNARDAMPDGGTLRISATAERVVCPTPEGLQPGDYVRLTVADTGTGMDAATVARAIEPFFSTKGIGRGTGLGLSMVHGLASQLGGALVIRSRVGDGTTMELWLPQSATAVATVDDADDAAIRSFTGRALLVDDEEIVRLSTADMLTELGYEVVEAASAEEALGVLGGTTINLLVTDHLMPGMTGVDLAHEVRRRRPGTPILLVSGFAEVEGLDAALPRLVKPFRKDELATGIERLSGIAAVPVR